MRGSALAPLITGIGLAGIVGAFVGGRAVDAFGAARTPVGFVAAILAAPALMLVLGVRSRPHRAA